MKARVLVADDHPVVRDGLRFALRHEGDLEVVAEAGCGREALALACEHRPDLILMDVNLGDMSGIEVAREVLERVPQTRILVLSGYPDPEPVRQAIAVGISGYLLKVNASNDLVQAMRAVLAGMVYLCPEAATILVNECKLFLAVRQRAPENLLSERDRSLLKLIADGRRNKEIAGEMGLTVKSVETYRSLLMKRLRCSTPAELVRYAIREGIAAV